MESTRTDTRMIMKSTRGSKLMLLGVVTMLIFSACNKRPTACFNPDRIAVIPGKFINFYNCSTNADSYSWDFGDGNTSTLPSPFNGYANKGVYEITLEASTVEGKVDRVATEVYIGDPGPFQIVIDSVAFPDLDGLSVFTVELDGEELISTSITPFELPFAVATPADKVWATTTTSATLRVVTDLDDYTFTFNPHTDSDANLLVPVSHTGFWAGYVVLTGR